MAYRARVLNSLKLVAGAMYGANYYVTFDHAYGALFADAMQFFGRREKWGFEGQVGHGFYHNDYGEKAGVFYSVSYHYRAIISEKLLFTTSISIGYRNFHYEHYRYIVNNSGFMGLRFGVVF